VGESVASGPVFFKPIVIRVFWADLFAPFSLTGPARDAFVKASFGLRAFPFLQVAKVTLFFLVDVFSPSRPGFAALI